MAWHRRLGHRDRNHGEIVDALTARGYRVLDLAALGNDCPDILVSRPGANVLMEIKADGGKLSPGQALFLQTWPGPVHVVRTVEEALAAMKK